MKKLLLLAMLVSGLSVGQAMHAMDQDKTKQPPAQVQNLLKQNAEAIEQLIKQAKSVPALQATLNQISSIRGQLDAKMQQYKGQNVQQQPPADVQELIKQNNTVIDSLIKEAAAYPALKATVDKINSIRQQINTAVKQESKQAPAQTSAPAQAGVRKARRVS